MALRKLVRSSYGRKSPVSIKYENLHSFKEGVILLCQSILEARRISYLPGSAHFIISLRTSIRQNQINKTLRESFEAVWQIFIKYLDYNGPHSAHCLRKLA